MNFLKSTIIISSLTVLSRFTGYFRDMLMSRFVGVGPMGDALSLAIKLPAFFRRIFAEGAFHVSFLPLYTKSHGNKDFAGMTFSLLMSVLGLMTLGVLFYFPSLMSFVYKIKNPEVKNFFLLYGPILFPYAFFISLTSFFGSMLNAVGKFGALAFSHALSNIITILYVVLGLFLKSHGFFAQTSYGFFFASGIFFSGICQFLFVFTVFWRLGGRISLKLPQKTPLMTSFLKNFIPGMFSVGILQLNTLITAQFALRLPVGSLSLFHYADRLNQLPMSIVGVSLSSALLPALSYHLSQGDKENALKTKNQSLLLALLLTLPCSAFFLTFSHHIVSTIYAIGRFSPEDFQKIAHILMIYSLSIPGYVMMKILNTKFFAQGQNHIPFGVSVVGVIVDLLGCFFLYKSLAHLGLALASVFSAWSMVFLLISLLIIKEKWSLRPLMKDLLSLGCLFGILLLFWFGCEKTMVFFHHRFLLKTFFLLTYCSLGVLLTVTLGYFFGLLPSFSLSSLKTSVQQFFFKKKSSQGPRDV